MKKFLRAFVTAFLLHPLLSSHAQTPLPLPSQTAHVPYDIVYVRSPRTLPNGDSARIPEFSRFEGTTPGTDLMLLHPDGTEEVLDSGGVGALQDPMVDFTGTQVVYTRFHTSSPDVNTKGADIYKVDLSTRVITRLTFQGEWNHPKGLIPTNYGVYNVHPTPLPGGKIAFVSNRNIFHPPPGYQPVSLQLHTMNTDGTNIENIGHMNLGSALHPTVLTDGRICFSSLENMGNRNPQIWGIWCIWQDGTVWSPLVSAFTGPSAPPGWHFMTQTSDTNLIVEIYYNQNQKGFGTFFRLPQFAPPGIPAFLHGSIKDKDTGFSSTPWPSAARTVWPFQPYGMELLSTYTRLGSDLPAWPSDPYNLNAPYAGKVTHPAAAPNNDLLFVWTPGPIGGSSGAVPANAGPKPVDAGIYLLHNSQVMTYPGDQVSIIKNDPNYNEMWPRPVVPYQAIYGLSEPVILKSTLPQRDLLPGEPFGYVGTSSLYKRESAPLGRVGLNPAEPVTAWQEITVGSGNQRKLEEIRGSVWNWNGQGSDAGKYYNTDIKELCIVTFEPNAWTSFTPLPSGAKKGYPHYSSFANERLHRLGCIDVHANKTTTLDPDGNPDTSFLAKIPADVPFTFQMLDHNGLVLTTAQTWHQVRPGEMRADCGGCHAHSQQPTNFAETQAGQPGWIPTDLTQPGIQKTAEFYQDIVPLLDRCTGCHNSAVLAGNLRLDDMTLVKGFPQNYITIAQNTRYAVPGQARRSMLMWKLFGERLDGWTNDYATGDTDYPADTTFDHTTVLTSEERRTWAMFYDLYAMIDLAVVRPNGMRDDTPPTVTLHTPREQEPANAVSPILLGLHDYRSDINLATLNVRVNGSNIAGQCTVLPQWRWSCPLSVSGTPGQTITVEISITDNAGNTGRLTRTIRLY